MSEFLSRKKNWAGKKIAIFGGGKRLHVEKECMSYWFSLRENPFSSSQTSMSQIVDRGIVNLANSRRTNLSFWMIKVKQYLSFYPFIYFKSWWTIDGYFSLIWTPISCKLNFDAGFCISTWRSLIWISRVLHIPTYFIKFVIYNDK